VIPVDANGLKDAFNLPLEENRIIDIKFLHGCIRPTLCILYEDNRRSRHVKTSGIDLREKELIAGTWQQNNVDFSASLLIAVPSPLNGVIVIGLTTITYISGTGIIQTVEISPTQIVSYCRIDAAGTRYLLSDNNGQLMVLALHVDGPANKVISITTDILGITSIAECISYLENGIVFIGSTLGDSQLIKLLPSDQQQQNNNDNNSSAANGNIEILDFYTNIGPIVDMCLVDNHASGGQKQLVTCSGAYKDGSLRIIRSGIGIHEQASLEISGIKGIWSLRTSETAEYDKYLVQSFTTETRILAIEGEELGEVKDLFLFF
jgi:DNA damage-binding protein 1